MLEGFGRNDLGVSLGTVFHGDRRPFEGFAVEVVEVLEGPSRQEIGFRRPEAAFLARFAVSCELHPIRTMAKSISG